MRSASFFNSDVDFLAENVAWDLGADYGLDADEQAALSLKVQDVIHAFFAARSSEIGQP